MKIRKAVIDSILTQGLLPLFYDDDEETTLQVTRTLYRAGIRVIEYTNRGEHALPNFKALLKVRKKEMPDLLLGIGTIKTVSEAEAFIDAGTDFIVSPIINIDIAKITRKHKLLYIPGCMTPTEIALAQQHHSDIIKIFPANIVGPAFISSVKDIFPGQLFIPTGGVDLTAKSISEWFHAGVCAVGMGSKLIGKGILEKKLYDQLYDDTVRALEIVKAVM